MSDYISEELLSEILKRLSIEDAVRCTSVCKSWYSLITSPSFISLHSTYIASSTNKDLLLVRDYHHKKPNKELYSSVLLEETVGEYRPLNFPIRGLMKDTYFRIIGCVNGVVCLSDDISTYTLRMVLWNPSIKKFLGLPRPIFTYTTHGGFMHTVGFGFDDATNDFKVVRVVYLMDEGSMVPPMVEVFEPNVGAWREVDAKGFPHIIDERGPQVFLHGNVHWVIGCKEDHDFWKQLNSPNLIVSFDLRTEVFAVMKAPDSLNGHQLKQNFWVSVLGESLSLIHDTPSEYGNSCCIWVMKEYGVSDSWTKMFSVDVTGGFWRVLGFQRNGEALVKAWSMYHRNLKHLVSFEPKSRKLKIIADIGGDLGPSYVDNFVETLALIGVKGDFVLDIASVDTNTPDKESCEPEDESRCFEPPNLSRPDNLQPVYVQVSWFGGTD